jgi:hypothetical protein
MVQKTAETKIKQPDTFVSDKNCNYFGEGLRTTWEL